MTTAASVGVALTPKIEVAGLGKRFGRLEALRDVSFAAGEGEFLAIIGPSGCGKTTLLLILAGLEPPTAGEVHLRSNGRVATAMVFQGRSLFPWYTVRGNVEYGLRMRGVPRGERRIIADGLIEAVGLRSFRDTYPSQLSEGMRQRVGIARALATDPEILLMDEPFANLDEQNRLLMQEELLRIWARDSGFGIRDSGTDPFPRTRTDSLRASPPAFLPSLPQRGREGQGEGAKTVLFVTHSLEEAVLLADRVLVMTAQPGTIKASLLVPFGRPRDFQRIRRDPAFGEITARLWDLLRDEVLRSQSPIPNPQSRSP